MKMIVPSCALVVFTSTVYSEEMSMESYIAGFDYVARKDMKIDSKALVKLRQALWQVPLLMIMACLIALAVNHWREAPLPLFGDWSVTARLTNPKGDSLVISLDQAKQLYGREGALFVDARPRSQYEDGHISGALSLPWQDATNTFTDLAAKLEEKDSLVTYCDGEDCALSHDLAMFLKDMGFAHVRVLVNGWTVWQAAGLPIQKEGGRQ